MDLDDKLFDLKIPEKDKIDLILFHTIQNVAKIDAIISLLSIVASRVEPAVSAQDFGEQTRKVIELNLDKLIRELIERGY